MKNTHIILIFVAVYYLIFGVVAALFTLDSGIKFLHIILNAFFAFTWCKIHAVENNKKPSI